MKETIVISAFPASGKTTYKDWNCDREMILDSDSSQFSWEKDVDGINTTTRNPEFPSNYIKHIQENIGKFDIIFVSSHDAVRKALKEHNIPYVLVFPEKNMKLEWECRMKARGDDEKFVSFIIDNWDKFIDDMDAEIFPKKFRLHSSVNEGAITSTVMNYIRETKFMEADE